MELSIYRDLLLVMITLNFVVGMIALISLVMVYKSATMFWTIASTIGTLLITIIVTSEFWIVLRLIEH